MLDDAARTEPEFVLFLALFHFIFTTCMQNATVTQQLASMNVTINSALFQFPELLLLIIVFSLQTALSSMYTAPKLVVEPL